MPRLIPILLLLLTGPAIAQPSSRPTTLPDVRWTPMPLRTARQAECGMAGGEGGQLVLSIARSPADDDRIYLAVDVVGVWRSDDGGFSWAPCQQQGFYCLGASSIAASPLRADEILVYADAPDWEKPRHAEEGLYRSTDGGRTFARVLDVPNPDPRRLYRHLIEYAPDGRRVYFASFNRGLFRSDDGGATWRGPLSLKEEFVTELCVDARGPDTVWAACEDGLYVSRNGGQRFDRIESLGEAPVWSIALDPADAQRLRVVQQGRGLMQSADAGRTFAPVSSGDKAFDAKIDRLFQSPVDARRLILASFNQLRASDDGGKTWAASKIDYTRSYVQRGPWAFTERISWSRRRPAEVVAALSCGIYASADGGARFRDSMAGYTGLHHGWSDCAVAFASGDPDRIAFFCYDYNFNITLDGGRTFENRHLEDKVAGWWGMYAGDMHPQWNKTPVVVAAAGNYGKNKLVRSDNAGRAWREIDGTEGSYFFVRFHPTQPNIVYADDRRSDDNGRTFRKLSRAIWAMAPSRPDTVYSVGDGKVWRSDDRGDTWKPLPDPPSPAGDQANRRDLEVDPTDPDRLWAMTPPNAAVFDGKTWRTVPASQWLNPRAHGFVNRFAIDPRDPQRVIMGLDAIGDSYLFLSDDGGNTWQDITANLPRLGPSQSLNIHPKTGRIFMGAGFGTWTTDIRRPPRSEARKL